MLQPPKAASFFASSPLQQLFRDVNVLYYLTINKEIKNLIISLYEMHVRNIF